jgi:hypothetical protein
MHHTTLSPSHVKVQLLIRTKDVQEIVEFYYTVWCVCVCECACVCVRACLQVCAWNRLRVSRAVTATPVLCDLHRKHSQHYKVWKRSTVAMQAKTAAAEEEGGGAPADRFLRKRTGDAESAKRKKK